MLGTAHSWFRCGATHLELAEQEDAVSLLLQPGQQLVQQHQLAGVLHQVLLLAQEGGKPTETMSIRQQG